MNRVTQVQALSDGWVSIEMSDGRHGRFDVKPYMRSAFFNELANEAYFRQVKLFFDGIGWPNGQDLGPDTHGAKLRHAWAFLPSPAGGRRAGDEGAWESLPRLQSPSPQPSPACGRGGWSVPVLDSSA